MPLSTASITRCANLANTALPGLRPIGRLNQNQLIRDPPPGQPKPQDDLIAPADPARPSLAREQFDPGPSAEALVPAIHVCRLTRVLTNRRENDARRDRVHPRFRLHVLPSGFHRIRHYGLFAGTVRARNIARPANAPEASTEHSRNEADSEAEIPSPAHRYPCCGGRMIIVETFLRRAPRALASAEPDQDRHLMTVAALPAAKRRFPSPPATARRRCPHNVRRPSPGAAPTPAARMLALEKDRYLRLSPEQRAPPAPKAPRAFHPRPQPIGRARPNRALSSPRFLLTRLSDAGPAPSPARPQRAAVRNPSAKRATSVDLRERETGGNARARAVSRSWGSRIRRRSRSAASINSQTRPHFVRRRI